MNAIANIAAQDNTNAAEALSLADLAKALGLTGEDEWLFNPEAEVAPEVAELFVLANTVANFESGKETVNVTLSLKDIRYLCAANTLATMFLAETGGFQVGLFSLDYTEDLHRRLAALDGQGGDVVEAGGEE